MRESLVVLLLSLPRGACLSGSATANSLQLLENAFRDSTKASGSSAPESLIRRRLTEAYQLHCPRGFGLRLDMLPMSDERMFWSQKGLEDATGIRPAAFAPLKKPPQTFGLKMAPLESAAGLAVGAALTAAGLLQDDLSGGSAQVLARLKELESYELILLSTVVLLSTTTLIAIADKMLLDKRLLEALAMLLPQRRATVARHEAGHFLCAHLLSVPVQACELNPLASLSNTRLRARAGTVFLSPALEALRAGEPAQDEDVDVVSIVLMGGIAAEAVTMGHANGGSSDERALQALLQAHHAPRRLAQEELRARARWAAAFATNLLQRERAAFDALSTALAEGRSVSECALTIERTLGTSSAGAELDPSEQ